MATIDRTTATLRVRGEQLDPDQVSALIGKTPTRQSRKGEPVLLPSGGLRIARTGTWVIETEWVTPGDLDIAVQEIFKGTTPDLSIWLNLSTKYRVDLFCGLLLSEPMQGISVSPPTLKLLGERGIELGLDVYEPDKDR